MQQAQELKGKVMLIRGDYDHVRRICVNTALKLQAFSEVMFIDTANAFSTSELVKNARDISKIRFARPFSLEQLKKIIFNVPEERGKSSILMVSSIDGLAASKHPKDAMFIMHQILSQLKYITHKHGLITIYGYEGIIPWYLAESQIDSAYLV